MTHVGYISQVNQFWKNWKESIVAVDSRNESTVARCVGRDVYGFHDYHGHWHSSWPWKPKLIDGNQVGTKRWCHGCHGCHILNLCGSFVSIQWLLRSACEPASERSVRCVFSQRQQKECCLWRTSALSLRVCALRSSVSCFNFLPVYYIVWHSFKSRQAQFFFPPFFSFFLVFQRHFE